MTARVLVVDDLAANVRLLTAKLEAEYYEVITAFDGAKAIELARTEQPDIILLDVMMPGINGFETCKILKESIETRHIPVILVTALDGQENRLEGLEAGADDFLTKPIDDVLLLAKLKALVRLKQMIDDVRQREANSRRVGLSDATLENPDLFQRSISATGNVLIVDDNVKQAERLLNYLAEDHRCAFETDTEKAARIAKGRVDLVVVNLVSDGFDALRWVAHLRSQDTTRQKPILGIINPEDKAKIVKALELGVNDLIYRPVVASELRARARTQIKRKRFVDFLKNTVDRSMEMAVTDSLTGLNNRRFMDHHLTRMFAHSLKSQSPLSVLVLDLDRFKSVNDTYGHDIGDEVLKEFARRIGHNVRAIDLPCRMGGEEFVVLMPDTDTDSALIIAERVRTKVASDPFILADGRRLDVTVSVGVATSMGLGDSIEALMKRADEGVYQAKETGRNRVVLFKAA